MIELRVNKGYTDNYLEYKKIKNNILGFMYDCIISYNKSKNS